MGKRSKKCNTDLEKIRDRWPRYIELCKKNAHNVDFKRLMAKNADKSQVNNRVKMIRLVATANKEQTELLNMGTKILKEKKTTIKMENDENLYKRFGTKGETYKKLKRKIDELYSNDEDIYIVNAGSMNHGKSSLFNSLLDREAYAVGDVRMTKIRQKEKFREGVYFVDTPGLGATDEDNDEAVEAYKSANMVVFAHTPKIGELHEEEIKCINKIASLFPSKKYFWKHFCLVFTFSEGIDAEELKKIKSKILADIEKHCQGKDFPVFEVSNLRYGKGKKLKKEGFIQHSGILELRKYLLDNIKDWRGKGKKLKKDKAAVLIKQEVAKLESQKAEIEAKLRRREQDLVSEKNRLNIVIDNVFDEVEYVKRQCECKEKKVASIKEKIAAEVAKLYQEHEAYKFNFLNEIEHIKHILDCINADNTIKYSDVKRYI